MRFTAPVRSSLIRSFAAVSFLSAVFLLPARADSVPSPKGAEVTTVGTGPYAGPLPEELAKLAQQQALPETAPLSAKEPAVSTMTTVGADSLTLAEQVKLEALRIFPVTLPLPLMIKLEPMHISKEGTAVLTPQEREKHANERVMTNSTPIPVVPASAKVSR
jgi:hypothetical protein